MSGEGVIDLPVSGRVDAALIRGLIDLGEALKSASTQTDVGATKAERATVSWKSFSDGIGKAADKFNEVHAAISTQVAMINDLVDSVARLATEQAHLDAASSRLGLDFDEASAAAGRFADETDALAVANQFRARDITLTQTEINALMRVAGAHAEELGVTVGQAAEQLTQALIRGREGGLDRFGQALGDVAGEGVLMGERLDALVRQAGQVQQGTDDAATSMDRMRDSMDDAKRVAASAFVDTITRINGMTTATQSAGTEVESLNTRMEALGRTAARTLELIGRPIAALVGGVAIGIQGLVSSIAIMGAFQRGGVEAAAAERTRQSDTLRALMDFTSSQASGAAAAWGDTNERTTDGNGPTSDPARRPGQSAAATRDAAARGTRADMSFTEQQSAANNAAVGAHGQTVAVADDGLERSDYARQTESEKLKSEERRAAAAHGTHQARKEELAKLAEIHDAEQRVRQETELRLAGARELAAEREREARDFDRWLASQTDRLAAEQEREKAQERAKRDRDRDDAKQRDTGNQLRDYFTRQMRDANTMADVVEGAYSRMTGAASAHFGALVTGRETAGQALQGFVHDTLTAFAEIAAQQAMFELGKGFAALFLNPAEAAAHFGAAALFGVVAAGAGALSQAVPATAASGGAGSPAGSAAGPNRGANDRRDTSNDNAAPVVVNYYAPVIGGRESTDAELGVRLGRYDDAARARRTRRAA